MEPVIFFALPPNFEEICGFTVFVKPSVMPSFSTVQTHITKCREIIFTESDLLASPSYDVDACFNIIMLQSNFKSGRVQTRLHRQGHQVSKPYRVLPSFFQSCLTYTVLARLAPSWNKAGEWLIQGRDFLVHTGYTNAIKMQLCVNKSEIYLTLSGSVVKFPPLQVEDLDLSRREMQEIIRSTENQIREVTLADCWCHVLPSMKRGRIVSLSLNIARESPFTSYRDLQRHWKNMYGYRLPDTDEDILYCQIGFLPSGGGKHFTYPSICLRSGPLQLIQRVDPKPILAAFLQDIHCRIGTVCGHPLRFQTKLCFVVPALHVASQETGHINLSSKPVNRPTAPMRSQKSLSDLYNGKKSDMNITVREKLCEQKAEMLKENRTEIHPAEVTQSDTRLVNELTKLGQIRGSSIQALAAQTGVQCTHDHMIYTNNEEMSGKDYGSGKTIDLLAYCSDGVTSQAYSSLAHTQTLRSEHMNIQHVTRTKFVPHFKPKPKHKSDNTGFDLADSNSRDSTSTSFVPAFKPRILKTDSVISTKKKTKTQDSHGVTDVKQSLPSSKLFTTGNSSSDRTQSVSSQHSAPVSVPDFRKQFKPKGNLHGAQKQESSKKKLVTPSVTAILKAPTGRPIQHSPIGLSKSPASSHGQIFQTGQDFVHISSTPFPVGASLTCKLPMTPKQANVKKATCGRSEDGACSEVKRKKLTEGEDTPKKSRVKPQVQTLDVESYARINQLGKVNAVTLMAWLKDRGVVCRSKDKKNDIVEKVYNYIKTGKPQQ